MPRTLRKLLTYMLSAAAILVAALFAWLAIVPAAIDPMSWDPPPSAEVASTHAMPDVQWLGKGRLTAPESAAVDRAGRIHVGCADGVIYRVNGLDSVEVVAEVGGRPLGLAFDPQGRLLVCNHPLGLQRVHPDGRVELLLTHVDGAPLHFPNDLAITSSGIVYLTDSSSRYHAAAGYAPPHGAYDMLEARPHGRLIRYDPQRAVAQTLGQPLHFPNGVALSEDELSLYIAETFRYRLLRYDLMSGEAHILIDNLPGFPDGLVPAPSSPDLYVIMGVRRSQLGDRLHRWPWLKAQITKFPQAWWHRVTPEAIVMRVSREGVAPMLLHDAEGLSGLAAGGAAVDGALYIGNLDGDGLARLALPEDQTDRP